MSLKALKDNYCGICFLYRSVVILVVIFSFISFFKITSFATSSDTSYFQGKIVIKSNGTNISENNPSCVINGSANDSCDFRVGYYSAATSGTLIYQEDFSNVELGENDGVFSLALGDGSTVSGGSETSYSDVFKNNSDVYMQISFDPSGSSDFSDPEIFTTASGRMQIRGVPYAITSKYLSDSNIQFIRNQTGLQTDSNFNISGNGSVGSLFTVGSSNILYANGSTNKIGIGTSTPTQQLSLWGGNADFTDPTILGSESLSNGSLSSGTDWTSSVDCALDSNAVSCSYSEGSESTFQQASASLAHTGVESRWYKFTYTVSSLSGTPSANITSAFASETTALSMTAGSHTIYFKSASAPTDFIISTTLSSGQGFTIDTLSLTEVQGGNLALSGILTGGGLTGLKVLSNGNVGIGTTSPTQALDVIGKVSISDFTTIGDTAVYKNADGVLGIQSSDIRLKKNIVEMQNSLDIIDAIRTVKFNWLNDSNSSQKTIGVIAQDLLPILPEAVFSYVDQSNGQTYYGVHYEKLGVLALDGIKGLSTELKSIKTEISTLNQPSTGDLWMVNNEGKLFSTKDVVLGNVSALGATISNIDTNKISVLDINVSGILTSDKIITKYIDARQDESIAIRLSEKIGSTGFNILNSEGKSIFSVNSLGDVNINGKLFLTSDGNRRISGTDNVPAWEVRARIDSEAITEKSKVFLSLTDNNDLFPTIKVSSTDNGYFEVMLDRILDYDTVFNWFVIN